MKKRIPGVVLALLLGLLSLSGCQSGTDAEIDRELERIITEIKVLHCRQERLEARVKRLWDDLNASLASALPEDIPEEEKAMMLSVKNAPLIRMFEVYDSLDVATQRLVDSVEMADKLAVDSFKLINDRIGELENERMNIFEQEEQKSGERLEFLRSRYNEVLNAPCSDQQIKL